MIFQYFPYKLWEQSHVFGMESKSYFVSCKYDTNKYL